VEMLAGASRDGFLDPAGEPSKHQRKVTIYASLQTVLGQGRGQGPAGESCIGAGAAVVGRGPPACGNEFAPVT